MDPEIFRRHVEAIGLPAAPPGTFVGGVELPWPQGTRVAPQVHWSDVGPVAVHYRGAATLTDLAAEYVFYHAGLLWSALGRDPATVFWAESGARDRPLLVELGCRIFEGELLDPTFSHFVWACPRELFDGLAQALDRYEFRFPGARPPKWHSTRFCYPILDPLLGRRLVVGRPAPPEPPLVGVHLCGLESDTAEYAWEPPADPWRHPACLVFRPKTPPAPPPR